MKNEKGKNISTYTIVQNIETHFPVPLCFTSSLPSYFSPRASAKMTVKGKSDLDGEKNEAKHLRRESPLRWSRRTEKTPNVTEVLNSRASSSFITRELVRVSVCVPR